VALAQDHVESVMMRERRVEQAKRIHLEYFQDFSKTPPASSGPKQKTLSSLGEKQGLFGLLHGQDFRVGGAGF